METGLLMGEETPRLTVRLLTPPATGAVAVLELAGPAAALQALLEQRLDKRVPRQTGTERPRLRVWHDAGGQPLDEVLVLWRRTGTDNDPLAGVELHLHGGRGILLGVLRSLAGPVELLAETPGGAETDAAAWPLAPAWARQPHRLRATYERALAESASAYVAKRLLRQLEAVPRWLAELRGALAAQDEAATEQLIEQARAGLELAAWIAEPPVKVALVGAQNAGKSTLFNALTGSDRVLVSPQAGTTRDPVVATIAVRGIPVELVDTAGLQLALESAPAASRGGASRELRVHLSQQRLEKRGQLRALRAVREAQLLLYLQEADTALPAVAELETARPVGSPPFLAVATKCDRPAAASLSAGWHGVAALTGEGLEALLEAIGRRLRIPPTDTIVPLLPLGPLRALLTDAADPGEDEQASRASALAALDW